MKKAIALLVCTAGVAGCFTSNIVVTVRTDGSGFVEQTTIVRPAAISEFARLVSPELAAKAPDLSALARELRRYAAEASLGRNLRVRTVSPVTTADTTGLAVTYDFDDVTAIDLDLMPHMPGGQGFYGIAAQGPASTRLTMTLEPMPDGLERLTIQFPRFAMDPSAEPPASWATGTVAEMAAFRNVMKGSRISIVVKSEAPIVRTNSPLRQDNRVTLLDADVEAALFSTQIGMLATTPSTFDELLTEFADLPGVALAREHTITIDIENPSASLSAPAAPAQRAQAAPDTEIFLASLLTAGGRFSVGAPINISRNPGYDNQPSFSPDGRQILFSSVRRQELRLPRAAGAPASATPLTDIYRYELSSRSVFRVTSTPEGEFSPTVMPNGSAISVVRVEGDGTQRLWRVTDTGPKSETSVILPDVKPVGYYAWLDQRDVALFVLGEPGQAATLQVADTLRGKAQVVASNIGRSLQRTPTGTISFVQREAAAGEAAPALMIKQLTKPKAPEQGPITVEPLVRPPAGTTEPYLAWTPDGTLLVAVNSILYRWRAGETGWTPVANLGAFGLRDVSRLAVSPKGDRIAIVALAKQER
jgi:hypothetical protein